MRADVFEKEPADLIAKIKGEYKPTAAMSIGTLIHAFLEKGTIELKTPEGLISLSEDQQLQLMNINFTIGNYISEVRFTYNLTSDIVVSGIIDKILGVLGAEVKTGARFYGVDFYDKSLQWKLYCEALGLQKFTYFHIQVTEKNYHLSEMSFYPYKGMRDELISEANSFIKWCKLNNLDKYIEI